MTVFHEPDPLNPEGDTTTAFPDYYARGAQIRQFGVGGASTKGQPPNAMAAMANPPEAMVTAAGKVLTEPMITVNDLERYFPSATYVADVTSGGGGTDGGGP
jgi:hypothetical protein